MSGLRADGADPAEIHEYLSTCARCVIALPSHEAAGERFQVYSVSTAGDSYSFASFVVRNDCRHSPYCVGGGRFRHLSDLGHDGSLVAQEAIYEPQDAMCCPSGWSVRLFRYQDGRFIEGDTFESPVDYAEPEGEKSMETAGIRLLMIEDDEVIREATTLGLSRLGYLVEGVEDGLEGLERLKAQQTTNPVDAVLLDVMLPTMNGTQVCRALRRFSQRPGDHGIGTRRRHRHGQRVGCRGRRLPRQTL